MVGTKGMGKGNRNAAKPGPKRIRFSLSLSGDVLANHIRYLQEQGIEPTEEQIINLARTNTQLYLKTWQG